MQGLAESDQGDNQRDNDVLLIVENQGTNVGALIPVRVSHYTPWVGGTNCYRFSGGHCVSKTASGERWEPWVNKGMACPPEWPFGKRLRIEGQTWECVDRGGKIVIKDGIPWVDLMTAWPPVPYGTIVQAEIIK